MFGKKQVYVFKEDKPKGKAKAKGSEILTDPPQSAPVPDLTDSTPITPEPAAPESQKTATKATKQKPPKEPREKVPFLRSKRKIGVTIIAVSLFALLVVSPMLNYLTATKYTTAVVATQEIPKGVLIEEAMLARVRVPAVSLLPIHIGGAELAVNRYAKTDIAKDELIPSSKLSDAPPFADSYLYLLPSGKKALSVTLPTLSTGLSGKLRQGDIVSLYVRRNETEQDADFAAQLLPELTYLEVLAVTNAEGYDISPAGFDLEDAMTATVTLAVDDTQAGLLAGLEQNGSIHAALVCRGDTERAASLLAAQEGYLAEAQAAEKEDKPAPPPVVDSAAPITDSQPPREVL